MDETLKSTRRSVDIKKNATNSISIYDYFVRKPVPDNAKHNLPKSTGTIRIKPQQLDKQHLLDKTIHFYETSTLENKKNLSPRLKQNENQEKIFSSQFSKRRNLSSSRDDLLGIRSLAPTCIESLVRQKSDKSMNNSQEFFKKRKRLPRSVVIESDKILSIDRNEDQKPDASFWGYPLNYIKPVHDLKEQKNYLSEYIPDLHHELESAAVSNSLSYKGKEVNYSNYTTTKDETTLVTFQRRAQERPETKDVYQLYQQKLRKLSQNGMNQEPKQKLLENMKNIQIQRRIPQITAKSNTGNRLFLERYFKKIQNNSQDKVSEVQWDQGIMKDEVPDSQFQNSKELKIQQDWQELKKKLFKDRIEGEKVKEISAEDKALNNMIDEVIKKDQTEANLKKKLKMLRKMEECGDEFRRTLRSPRHFQEVLDEKLGKANKNELNQLIDNPKQYAMNQIQMLNQTAKKGQKMEKSLHDQGTDMLLESVVGAKRMAEAKTLHLLHTDMYSDKSMQKALEILNQRTFLALKKIIHESKSKEQEKYQKDANYVFQKILQKNNLEVANPPQVRDNVLKIAKMPAELEICKALRDFLNFYQESFQTILIQDCQFDDQMLSLILDGIIHRKNLQRLILRSVELNNLSLRYLNMIILRQSSKNLRELRLVGCKMPNQSTLDKLMQTIVEEDYPINSLVLVKCGVSATVIQAVTQFISNSRNLDELDLSWNDLNAKDFAPLILSLNENNTIRILNLSWNTLIGSSDQSAPPVFELQKDFAGSESVLQLMSQKHNQNKNEPHMKMVSRCITNFIRHNTKLQHLNLENCNLGQQFLIDIIFGLKRAKSLQALHVSQNPGVTTQVQNFWCGQLKLKRPIEDPLVFFFKNTDLDMSNPDSHDMLRNEKIELEFLATQKEVCSMQEIDVQNPIGQTLAINRILGYKSCIPGSQRWRLQTKVNNHFCHMCDFFQLSVWFWNEEIGAKLVKSTLQLTEAKRLRIMEAIQQQPSYKKNKIPQLYCEFNDWQGVQFVKLQDFFDKEYGRVPSFKVEANEYIEQEYQDLPAQQYQAKIKFIETKTKEFLNARHQNWKKLVLDKIRQPNPILINTELVKPEAIDNTYLMIMWLPPGRHHVFIDQVNQDGECKSYYSRQVVEVRKEIVMPYVKLLKKSVVERAFFKPRSQFAKWKEDTVQIIKDCFNHDLKQTKLKKFIKIGEYDDVVEILEKNFSLIKEMFLNIVGNSNCFPRIDKNCFDDFCKASGIKDEDITDTVIQIAFTATNFHEDQQPSSPEQQNVQGNKIADDQEQYLNRYEFMEILVRLAYHKYIESDKASTYTQAIESLIKECILPMQSKFYSWQKFREEEVWTLEVNDVLEANAKGLLKLYNQFARIEKCKNIKYESVVHMFQTELKAKLNLSKRQINQGYILSKMTVIAETENQKEYKEMQYCEFLEMLCRLAEIRFEGTQQLKTLTLQDRLEFILEPLLQIVKTKLIRVNFGDLQATQSDDDY